MSELILRNRLWASGEELHRIRKSRRDPPTFQAKQEVPTLPRETLGGLIGEISIRIVEHKTAIQKILESLDQADPAVRTRVLGNAWKEYVAVSERSRTTFQECLDMISGLQFRQEGFGSDLCQLADGLITACAEHVRSVPIDDRTRERGFPSDDAEAHPAPPLFRLERVVASPHCA